MVEDGDEHLTLHSLRASWRSWALELGVPLDIAELAMGHVGGLQRAGYSEAAGRYTRSRALSRQAAALNRVAGTWTPFGSPPDRAPQCANCPSGELLRLHEENPRWAGTRRGPKEHRGREPDAERDDTTSRRRR